MEVESAEHLAAAEKAAAKSFVLLKNNGILPLKKRISKQSELWDLMQTAERL